MTKKKLCKIFKDNDLRIAVEANKKVTDFLDITLDLHTVSFKPYKKTKKNKTTTPSVTSTAKVITHPQSSKIYQKI